MMKKFLAGIMTLAMALSMAACTSAPSSQSQSQSDPSSKPLAPSNPVVLMATTTSTDNTGLLDYLAPLFKEETGYELQWTAVGTGDAIKKGEDGEVDVILVHAKAREDAFVEAGHGVERFPVMYNDYVIVGPKDGVVAYTDDINSVFTQVKEESLTFVSRGDDSGTHTKETGIWKALEITDYEANKNYVSAGAGMGDTLVMADEMEGYCLTDRGTWLAKRDSFPNMDIVCEGDKNLLNPYGVIAVNPDKYADLNNEGANAFIEWICAPSTQEKISAFGVDQYGSSLFFPNANK